MNKNTVAILVGGLGTRIRHVIGEHPKPMFAVKGKPFLAYLFDYLKEFEIEHVVLCCGYKATEIKEYFGDEYQGIKINYSIETTPLGTAGALSHALPYLIGDQIFVMNGDSFVEVDLNQLSNFHSAIKASISIATTYSDDVERYGSMVINDDGEVLKFQEKIVGNRSPGWINGGVYLINRNIIEIIPDLIPCSLEKEIFQSYINHGLYAFQIDSRRFIDIGTPATLIQVNEFFNQQEKGL
jgi:D-glycero-alpha-D-manno-heptose 1-phosphate guanylyltransferase